MTRRGGLAVVGIRPQQVLPAGRYLLDADGRLHPWRHRGFIRSVAVVTIRPLPRAHSQIEIPAKGNATADHGGGCEARAPEGTIGALAGQDGQNPENVRERHIKRNTQQGRAEPSGRVETGGGAVQRAGRPPVSSPAPRPPERINLSGVTSDMDRRAGQVVAERTAKAQAERAAQEAEGMAWCRCGARDSKAGGMVPAWFGEGCIERECGLRGAAHG